MLTDVSQQTHAVCPPPTQHTVRDIPGVRVIRHFCFVNSTLSFPDKKLSLTHTHTHMQDWCLTWSLFVSFILKLPINIVSLHSLTHTHSSRVNEPQRSLSYLTLDLSQDSTLPLASGLHCVLHNCPQLSFISHTLATINTLADRHTLTYPKAADRTDLQSL